MTFLDHSSQHLFSCRSLQAHDFVSVLNGNAVHNIDRALIVDGGGSRTSSYHLLSTPEVGTALTKSTTTAIRRRLLVPSSVVSVVV